MNIIEESATLIGEVTLGSGNYVGHNSLLVGPLVIGDNNYIGNSVTIGTAPQDDVIAPGFHNPHVESKSHIYIGSSNVIREYVTIHKGLVSDTSVGSDNYLMAYSHISHDSKIENFVKIANAVQMGGFSTIMSNSYLGLSCILHQFTVIGSGCMIGMNSTVVTPIKPCSTAVGSPAKVIKPNNHYLTELGIIDLSWWSNEKEPRPDLVKGMIQNFDREVLFRKAQRLEVKKIRARLQDEIRGAE
jgi:UDP-N-acetylglucosamine acyltransferase